MKTTVANRTKNFVQKVPFHVSDAKGRAIGCLIITNEFDLVPAAADANWYNIGEPGHYFHAEVQAAKNGESWGAGQCGKSFATAEERDVYIKARVSASRKAAEKKSANEIHERTRAATSFDIYGGDRP